VFGKQQVTALCQMQVYFAFKVDRPFHIPKPFGNDHFATTGFDCGFNGSVDCRKVVAAPGCVGAVILNVEVSIRNVGELNCRQDFRLRCSVNDNQPD